MLADAVKALDTMLGVEPAQAEDPTPPAAKEDAETDAKVEGAVVAKAEKDDAAQAAPDTVQPQDLDWAPESQRSKLSSLDKDTRDWLKDKVLLKEHYTKTRQKEVPEIESLREDADFARRLKAHPEAAAAAFRVLDGKAEKVEEPADDFDIITATPAERKAYFAKIAREEAVSEAAKVKAEIAAPQQRVASIQSALGTYISDEGADVEAVKAALQRAVAHANEDEVVVTAENVVRLVKREIGRTPVPHAKTNGAATRSGDAGLGKVASPNGRGSSAVAPPEQPAWVREHRGPKPGAETLSLARSVLKDLGHETTTQGLDAIIDSLR